MKRVYARADSGFYYWQTVEAYEKIKCRFIVVARKTARLVDELQAALWKRSPLTDADSQCEFFYQPDGWGKVLRLPALRFEKLPESKAYKRRSGTNKTHGAQETPGIKDVRVDQRK